MMKIGAKEIGPGQRPYVIAEIGVNHDGQVSRALELTDAAAEAGADAVKLQLFETDRLMSRAAKLAAYQKDAGETDAIAMLRRLELSIDQMTLVVGRAHERGIHAIVTVFSVELVEPAARLGWDAYKSASPDIINKPLLEAMAATGKPLIVSTGASTPDEVQRAAGWLEPIRDRLAMLQCVSSYPAPEPAFGGIAAIAHATGLPTGYSDHTRETETGMLAVRAGACVLERHITHDRSAAGPDHTASLEPDAFGAYVAAAKEHQSARPADGGVKELLACEREVRRVSRQSLVSTRPIEAGETLKREMLTIKRPGTGIEPFRLDGVIGRRVVRDLENDVPIVMEDLA